MQQAPTAPRRDKQQQQQQLSRPRKRQRDNNRGPPRRDSNSNHNGNNNSSGSWERQDHRSSNSTNTGSSNQGCSSNNNNNSQQQQQQYRHSEERRRSNSSSGSSNMQYHHQQQRQQQQQSYRRQSDASSSSSRSFHQQQRNDRDRNHQQLSRSRDSRDRRYNGGGGSSNTNANERQQQQQVVVMHPKMASRFVPRQNLAVESNSSSGGSKSLLQQQQKEVSVSTQKPKAAVAAARGNDKIMQEQEVVVPVVLTCVTTAAAGGTTPDLTEASSTCPSLQDTTITTNTAPDTDITKTTAKDDDDDDDGTTTGSTTMARVVSAEPPVPVIATFRLQTVDIVVEKSSIALTTTTTSAAAAPNSTAMSCLTTAASLTLEEEEERTQVAVHRAGCEKKVHSQHGESTTKPLVQSQGSKDTSFAAVQQFKAPVKEDKDDKAALIDSIQIGTRIAVYWDGEDEYYTGTVKKERNHVKRFFVKYDDGDREWLNLFKHTFRILRGAKDDCKRERDVESKATTVEMKQPSKPCKGEHTANDKRERGTTTTSAKQSVAPATPTSNPFVGKLVEDWVGAGCQGDASSDSDTDDDEVLEFAQKMFGISPPRAIASQKTDDAEPEFNWDTYAFADVHVPISEKVKLGRRRNRGAVTTVEEPKPKKKRRKITVEDPEEALIKAAAAADEEVKRKKKEAKALTADEIRSILGDDIGDDGTGWVRRSVRQPSKSVLNSPQVKALFEKLRSNDTDMVVLKMKKYLNDPDAPPSVLEAVLDALEENTNCEALYIQNFNEGMRDEQILQLIRILQRPACKIWCLNIGETYKVKSRSWKKFANGLRDTKITHMYASEHTIDPELKDKIRTSIRGNRKKHTMHSDPENLDTIVQCTHCWWNPINAKALRPFLKTRGCEHLLHDAEAQGLPGTMSAADKLV